MANLFTFFILYCNLFYYKAITKIENPKPTYQVILKADDLKDYGITVKKLDKIIRKENIKISWGIIGNSLDNPSEDYVQFLKNNADGRYYHFFNHGYLHLWSKNTEFGTKPYEYQLLHLRKTNDLVKDKTGIILDTFGAPNNAIDKNTTLALEQISQIKYWYYGDKSSNKKTFERIFDLEYGVGSPNYKLFKKSFENNKNKSDLYVFQIHPYMWNSEGFLNFLVVVNYLKSKGAIFVAPSEVNFENREGNK